MRMILLIWLVLFSPLALGSVTVTVNGSNHTIPQTNERGWGNAVTAWIQAITTYTLQPTGGTFTLSSDVNFGASYGLKSVYFSTRTANPSTSGLLRLANSDSVGWRNNANGANLLLAVDASDNLIFNSVILSNISGTQTLTNKTIDGDNNTVQDLPITAIKTVVGDANKAMVRDASGIPTSALIVNANVSGSAAIDYSKLNLGTSIVNADISAGAAIAYSKLNLTGAIVNNDLSAAVAINKGGTGQTTKAASFDALSPMTASGDIIYGGASGTGTRLPKGTDTQVLSLVSGVPAWVNGGVGSVTSVAMTAPSGMSVSGSPITTTGTLALTGVPNLTLQSKTANYTALVSDHAIIADASGGSFTITLYAVSGNSGKVLRIKKVDSGTNLIIIDGNASETIEGKTTISLASQFESVELVCDGSAWHVVSTYIPTALSAPSALNTKANNSNYEDAATLSLTPGEWVLNGALMITVSGGATTAGDTIIGISSTSGNSATGLVTGENRLYQNTSSSDGTSTTVVIPDYRVTVTSTTTYYLKMKKDNGGANLQYAARFGAKKIKF